MSRLSRFLVAALVITIFIGAPARAAAQPHARLAPRPTIPASAVARKLLTEHRFVKDDAIISGPLDLTKIDTVRVVFKCRECVFTGPVQASDVTFAKIVDLSGSTFTKPVDFRGATFEAPVLFRSSDEGNSAIVQATKFAQPVDFSLATFADFSSFSAATFDDDALFRDARFADAAFSSTKFHTAAFDRSSFRGDAVFSGSKFRGPATFSSGDFRKRSDFTLAGFRKGAMFDNVQFGDDASFLGANFTAATPPRHAQLADIPEAARFDAVAAAHNVNFTFATFTASSINAASAVPLASFSDLVDSGSLIFRHTMFQGQRALTMTQLQARDLVLDVGAVSRISGNDDQRAVLQSIEESAKARGDLSVANDAHYALRVDRSKSYSAVGYALDFVFYRGIAGYFVRPLRPLLVLALVIALVSLFSVIGGGRSDGQVGSRPRRMWRGTRVRCTTFVGCFLDKLSLVRPKRTDDGAMPLARRLEVFAYRLLIVCAILGLANSNPTLRQMVETLV